MGYRKHLTCTVEGCPNEHSCKGYCQPHYKRMRKYGTVGEHPIGQIPSRARRGKALCSFDGCEGTVWANGLCSAHNQQRQLGKELRPIKRQVGPSLGRREVMYRWRHGITVAQYEEIFKAQGGVCAICGQPPDPGRKYHSELHVDHDHSCCPGDRGACGKCVRGLLCKMCNVGIGNLGDSAERLEAAVVYLRKAEVASTVRYELVGVSPEDLT